MKRDSDTGEAVLRLKPVHADKVHYEIGSEATTGSSLVTSLQNFATSELVLCFLAMDSTGKHETGDPVEWRNTITLKHRLFQQEADRMCELQAAPPSPIYYTTDGSDPRHAGGAYDGGPFVIPKGAVVILAYAEKAGVQSDVLRVDVPQDIKTVKVNPDLPVEWGRYHEFRSTKETYEFLNRVKRYGASALGARLTVAGNRWIETSADEKLPLNGEQLEKALGCLRELLEEGQAEIVCPALQFAKGQDLLDWITEVKTELRPHEVRQSETT